MSTHRRRRSVGLQGSGGTDSVYSRALSAAFPCPFWTVAVGGCAPVLIALVHVLRLLDDGGSDSGTGGLDRRAEGSRTNAASRAQLRVLLLVSLLLSVVGYLMTSRIVPSIASRMLPRVSGVDIGKRGLGGPGDGAPVPESLGVVPGTIFLVCVTLTATFARTVTTGVALSQGDFNVAIGSITMAVLLGLMDDLVDLKWREKLVVGAVMALPLIGSYSGQTSVILPRQLRFLVAVQDGSSSGVGESGGGGEMAKLTWFGELLDNVVEVDRAAGGSLINLGNWYLVFIWAVVVFCTNAINIYAGINGIEAGQTYVTACAVAVMNLLELAWRGPEALLDGDGMNHAFSLLLMLPFIGTMLGYLNFNWFPARVFGGDVLPYYSGMTLAVAGILGHFSKSLFLLMIPQLLNFVYSLPQLFKIVPIPRHRLPRVDKKTGFMRASKVAPGDSRSNMTLLCAAVTLCGGQLHERTLCAILLAFQTLCATFGLVMRYGLGSLLYGWRNIFAHEAA